jgi:hypothetical protein
MINRHLFFAALLIFQFSILSAQQFRHPMLHSAQKVEMMRILIERQIEPAYGSWLLLKEHPLARLDYKPNAPMPVISRDGAFAYTKGKMEQDFNAVMLNALHYVVSGEDAHAEKALDILSIYADSLRYIPETNDAPLLAGLEGFKIIYALDVLRYVYSEKKPKGVKRRLEKVEGMFKRLFLPIMEKFYATPAYTNGNWGPVITKTYMAAGIYFNDRKMYSFACDFYLNGHDNGTIANYIDGETGQSQEAGRDQGHPQLALGSMAMVCELAWRQGDDLWSALDMRLLKGYEYIAQYNLGENVPFRTWTDVTGKYCNWQVISEKSRGRFSPIYEIAYNHYFRRKGFAMPYTKRVLDQTRPEPYNGECPPFASLFFYD